MTYSALRVPIRFQRIFIVLILFTSVYFLISMIFSKLSFSYDTNQFTRDYCHQPNLDIYDPEIMEFIKYQPPLNCSVKDWVTVEGNIAKITDEAKKQYGNVKCQFVDVVRSSDYSSFAGVRTISHTEYNLEGSDFFRVNCFSESGAQWESRMAGARIDQDIFEKTGWKHLPKDSLQLNVLIFGFDSLSRMTFMRKLPKSYKKLKSLGSIVLQGYNILGDGTPQAIIPLLTGRTELELPDTRRRMGNKATYVDVYPFIWNDYSNHGYVTAFMEDTPNTGIFTYRLKGFKTVPTDHYMRTYYVDAVEDFGNHKPYCMAGTPRHKIMLDYARHIFTVYPNKPKFVFGFHGELSHDSYNLIGAADDDLTEWIQWFEDKGYLNNTVLILMSDHGHRFASVRKTQQGKLEERLPFFSFRFPSWFQRKYREAYENFEKNANRLTTAFDVHATLASILKFDGAGHGSTNDRAISLFKEIPEDRTCSDAGIESHWCACLTWEKISESTQFVYHIGQEFVKFLNGYTRKYSDLCSTLRLAKVLEAAKFLPNRNVLAFKEANDADGYVPDMSGKTVITKEIYQLRIQTEPGNGLFEFSCVYRPLDEMLSFQYSDVSRINKYGNDSACIEDTQEQLRKYCHCKKAA